MISNPTARVIKTVSAGLLWASLLGLGLASALYLAWLMLAQVNFCYGFWHDVTGIDQHITRYGPQNRYRQGFAETPKAERERLFGAIVDAIHDQGRGLAALTYHDAQGRPQGTLLRPPEITHLNDVARLIDGFRLLGLSALAGLLIIVALIYRLQAAVPRLKAMLSMLAVAVGVSALTVLALGPARVFYWLHEQVFPPDHPWFFYYQDSLMSTLMKAPSLFGYIAVTWLILGLGLFAMLLYLIQRLLGRFTAPSPPAAPASPHTS